jgi:internalin A
MYELAFKLIAENKNTRSPFLDPGNCGLTEVPEEIGELVRLEECHLRVKEHISTGKKGY